MDLREFGERIKRAREKLGFSQEHVGYLTGKTQKAISQYENGTRRMFAADVERLAHALQVPVNYLYTGVIALDDLDGLILTEARRLKSVDEKKLLVDAIRVFCDLAAGKKTVTNPTTDDGSDQHGLNSSGG